MEAQACYSLGNTYTLLREYRVAEEYHARHLAAARKLQDRVGEGRACWSLGNAHAALGNHEKALYYAKEHYNISKEVCIGQRTVSLHRDLTCACHCATNVLRIVVFGWHDTNKRFVTQVRDELCKFHESGQRACCLCSILGQPGDNLISLLTF